MDDRVFISSIRDIAAGEELTYDYWLYDGDDDPAPCYCGSKSAAGSMYSPEELRKQRRAAARKKKKAELGSKKKEGATATKNSSASKSASEDPSTAKNASHKRRSLR